MLNIKAQKRKAKKDGKTGKVQAEEKNHLQHLKQWSFMRTTSVRLNLRAIALCDVQLCKIRFEGMKMTSFHWEKFIVHA